MKNDEVRTLLKNGLAAEGNEEVLFANLGKLLLPGISVVEEAKKEMLDQELAVKAAIQKALIRFSSESDFGITNIQVLKDDGIYEIEISFTTVETFCNYHDEIFNALKRETSDLVEDIHLTSTISETSVSLVESLIEKHSEDIRGLLKEGIKNNIPSRDVFEKIASYLYGESNFIDMKAYDEICERADEYFRNHDNKQKKQRNTFYVTSEFELANGYGVDIEVENSDDLRTVGKVFSAIAQHISNKNNTKVELCFRLVETIQCKEKEIPQLVLKKERKVSPRKFFTSVESKIS